MSKELEAFRDILGILSAVSGCEVDMNSERVRIVKSALQKLEAIDNVYKINLVLSDRGNGKEYVLKEIALKIIKEHKLLNYVLKNPKCAKMYNLKQEEIDLLKEVLK